jgi:hypothetical protein
VVPVAGPSVTIPPKYGAFRTFAEQEGLA